MKNIISVMIALLTFGSTISFATSGNQKGETSHPVRHYKYTYE